MTSEDNFSCPYCRCLVDTSTSYERTEYHKGGADIKKLIVDCAELGNNWVDLATTLSVPYKIGLRSEVKLCKNHCIYI